MNTGKPWRPRSYIDLSFFRQGKLFVAGWCDSDASFTLVIDGQPRVPRQVRVERLDVEQAGVARPPSGQPPGFALVADVGTPSPAARVTLQMARQPGGELVEVELRPVAAAEIAAGASLTSLGPALSELLSALLDERADPAKWAPAFQRSQGAVPGVSGGLEVVAADFQTGRGFAVGWVHAGPRSLAWVEGPEAAPAYSLAGAFRSQRADVTPVLKELPGGRAGIDAVFTVAIEGALPNQTWRLKVMTDQGVHTLGETTSRGLSANPLLAYRTLAGLGVPMGRAAERMAKVDWPLIAPMNEAWQAQLADLPLDVHDVGSLPAQPLASVVVPLYGRLDFVEPQLMKFSADPWFLAHVELIYVLDDPALVDAFREMAPTVAALYGVGFRWVWGGANRGFSGANNLGMRVSTAERLLFVNSDVFPITPGWVTHLCEVLNRRPEIGVVAPRLLHADGTLQHAGIRLQRREDLGIWINHHPGKGLQPSLDPVRTLSTVPAVTGACMALRRSDLLAVGGWDTGYLAGDFEDSDLCLKLREKGLATAYEPAIELTHLERQSFSSLGDGGFRTQLAILNAVRHQQRWASQVASLADEPAVPVNSLEPSPT